MLSGVDIVLEVLVWQHPIAHGSFLREEVIGSHRGGNKA
jgi:hypothetical protein